MLDDSPTDLALQEYQNKIITTVEEMTANGPISKYASVSNLHIRYDFAAS
jgi:hypothetical protein